jgi:hypothetical protein
MTMMRMAMMRMPVMGMPVMGMPVMGMPGAVVTVRMGMRVRHVRRYVIALYEPRFI